MNTKTLTRQRLLATGKRPSGVRHTATQNEQYPQYQQDPRTDISATAHTGDPSRSFPMLFQYEEAARYRSQELQESADEARLLREARLARRMRSQSENGARRARRALAGLFLG